MTFDKKIDVLIKLLPSLMKDMGVEVVDVLQILIGRKMEAGKVSKGYASGGKAFPDSEITFSKSKKLRNRSGDLLDSFGRHAKGTKIKVSRGKLTVEVESDKKYSNIHEFGGFIKATPTMSKKGKSTYKMAQWFWWMYFKTKPVNEFFKFMALSVNKRGGVKMPKRPYMKPAFKILRDKQLKILVDRFYKILVTKFETLK